MQDLDKYKRHFLFDISSGYVSGAVVYWNKKSKKPVIEFSTKKNIEVSEVHNITELRKNTALAVDSVCSAISNFVNLSVGEFFIESGSVFLSSPWIKFNNYTLTDERIKPFYISDGYLESILKNNFEDNKKQTERTLIDSQMVMVKANDYRTNLNSLVGQEVTKLDISILDTYMNSYNKEFIEKIINNYFSFIKLRFNSFLPVLFNQIKFIYDLEDDFIFLDMTGSVTDFGIFSDGNIKNISSLPVGKNHILNEIMSQGLASDIKIAQSILVMYLRKELEENLRKKVEVIIKDFGDNLRNDIEEILDKLRALRSPVNIFILASLETKLILRELSLFDDKKLIFIDENLIKNFVESEEGYFDPFLALEAEYIFYSN